MKMETADGHVGMAQRHVFDDGNPFAPELRQRQLAADAAKRCAKAESAATAVRRPVAPIFQRLKTRLHGLDVYSRHKELINNYVLYHRDAAKNFQYDTSNDRSIHDVIRENHHFLWKDGDLPKASTSNAYDSQKAWEANLAKKYYDKLFKEYCIADLSRYQTNQVAMRWRVEREVFTGKGQFICGDKRCEERNDLSSWEVNFGYTEHGQRKNALVKLRLCPNCSSKLNFHSTKRLIKKEKREKRQEKKRSHRQKEKKHQHKKRRKHKSRSSSSASIASESGDEEDDVGAADVKLEPGERQSSAKDTKAAESAAAIWSSKAPVEEVEKTLEDEFDEFIDDLLL